ncbi:hypothetical protein Hanom_Chr14g01291511 [Helianthus anomalus]
MKFKEHFRSFMSHRVEFRSIRMCYGSIGSARRKNWRIKDGGAVADALGPVRDALWNNPSVGNRVSSKLERRRKTRPGEPVGDEQCFFQTRNLVIFVRKKRF